MCTYIYYVYTHTHIILCVYTYIYIHTYTHTHVLCVLYTCHINAQRSIVCQQTELAQCNFKCHTHAAGRKLPWP